MACEKCGYISPMEREIAKWSDMPEMPPYQFKSVSRWPIVKMIFAGWIMLIVLIGMLTSSKMCL